MGRMLATARAAVAASSAGYAESVARELAYDRARYHRDRAAKSD